MSTNRNEGEGSKTADKDYRKGATEHAKSGRSEEAAKEAKAALDSGEEQKLHKAEEEGKKHSKGEDPELYRKNKPA